MPNLDPWINRSSNTNIQNENDNDKYIEEKYLFEDNIDVFYNEEDDDDFEEDLDEHNHKVH